MQDAVINHPPWADWAYFTRGSKFQDSVNSTQQNIVETIMLGTAQQSTINNAQYKISHARNVC